MNMPTPRKSRSAPAARIDSGFGSHEHRILLLQGGGALGAYHAGVYEGLAAGGFTPDWVVGISIGAINSALIAGNAPQHRLDRLREFWTLVSARAPVVLPDGMDFARPMMNQLAATSAMMFGIPGFFTPRMPMPQFAIPGTIGALSYYDTEPLRATLERLVDFDRINAGEMRLSLGTANVRTGESVYFDNTTHKIGASHVMASGALPPGFPPVEIDGEFYVDGGIMTNTPLAYVGKDFRMSALVIQVDLFSGLGQVPQTLNQVQERVKDIQFQSKARLSADEMRAIESLRSKLASVIERLPPKLRADPQVRELEDISQRGRLSVIHLVNRHDTASLDFKDYEFSRATVQDLWQGGLGDVRRVLEVPDACNVTDIGNGVRIFALPS
jgi:NTE family protein